MRGIDSLIDAALAEDLGGRGDITTELVVPAGTEAEAVIQAVGEAVVAGLSVCRRVFERIDRDLELDGAVRDGQRVGPGDEVLRLSGRAASILKGERTALNFLGRLSGIATLTAAFVARVAGSGTLILDTRKTTPGLRELEKAAVRAGGGRNHRFGLYDQVLIKDNHLRAAGGVEAAVKRAVRGRGGEKVMIEVEVEGLRDLRRAILAGADRVLLDNMPLDRIRRAVELRNDLADKTGLRVELEVSGRVNLRRVRALAGTGVDLISIGALTHSAPSSDFSLNLVRMRS